MAASESLRSAAVLFQFLRRRSHLPDGNSVGLRLQRYCPVTYNVTSRLDGSADLWLSFDRSPLASSQWYPELQKLSVQLPQVIPPYSPFTLVIPADQGFTVRQASSGTFPASQVLMACKQAGVAGSSATLIFQDGTNTGQLQLLFQNRSGAFENASMTSSVDLSAGETGEFSFTFTSRIELVKDEHIMLYLPGFSSPRQNAPVSFLCNGSTAFPRGVWFPSNFTLVFPLATNVSLNSTILIPIPSQVIFVPLVGYNRSRPLRLFTDARVWPTSAQTGDEVEFPRIGALWNTLVTFDPPLVEQPLQVNFSFTPMVTLLPGDLLLLLLPGFAGPSSEQTLRIQQQIPVRAFQVRSRTLGGSQAALELLVTGEGVPAGSYCLVALPASCLVVLADGTCDNKTVISLPSKVTPPSPSLVSP
eukprot:765852-Hanusia_phi.AAC.2